MYEQGSLAVLLLPLAVQFTLGFYFLWTNFWKKYHWNGTTKKSESLRVCYFTVGLFCYLVYISVGQTSTLFWWLCPFNFIYNFTHEEDTLSSFIRPLRESALKIKWALQGSQETHIASGSAGEVCCFPTVCTVCDSWWSVLFSDCLYSVQQLVNCAVFRLSVQCATAGEFSCIPTVCTVCNSWWFLYSDCLYSMQQLVNCAVFRLSVQCATAGELCCILTVCTVCNSWWIVLYSDCLYSVQLSGVYSLDACRLISRLWPIIFFLRPWPSTLAVDRKLALKVNILFYNKFSWAMMFDFDFDFSRPNIRYPFPHLYFPSSVLVTEGRRR